MTLAFHGKSTTSQRLLIGMAVAMVALAGGALGPSKTARAAGPCTTVCYASPAGNDANDGDTPTTAKKTIQAAINQVNAGGTVRVLPGVYNESAPGSTPTSLGGTYQFGLFFHSSRPGITLMGVTAADAPITNAMATQATVNTNATNNFGYSGIFVEAANTTVRGLKIGPNAAGDNKTIEVVGNNFTLRYATTSIPGGGGSVYINDFSLLGDVVKSYHILDNVFPDGTSVDIASGAGNTGPVTGREVRHNEFDLVNNGFNAISFSGSGGVPWFVNPVGGAIIKNNSFKNSTQYIRARGVYDNSQFNWKSYWTDNTYDKAAVDLITESPFDLRTYAYSVFTNVRRIGGSIQGEVDHGAPGDTVLAKAGTYIENVTIPTPLTLKGAGQGATTVRPAVSDPNCGGSGGGSLCAGASNVLLVAASNVRITALTVDGDNPALTSGIVRMGADLDARNGIITDHTAGTWGGLEVDHVTVKNVYLRGMYASSGGSFSFHHNTVANVQGDNASIAMFNFGGNGVMASNTVSWANDALSSNWSTGVQFLNNTITHSGSGIHTDNAGAADLIQANHISACQIDGYGIFVFVPSVAPSVRNNTVKGCAVAFSAWGGAVPVTTTVENNEFDGAGAPVSVPNTSDGTYVTTDQIGYGDGNVSVSLVNNSIRNFAFGLQVTQKGGKTATVTVDRSLIAKNGIGLENEGSTLTVTHSCVEKNTTGFASRDGGTPATTVAHRNSITKNTLFGANNTGANVMNAELNWWGSSSGPKLAGSNKINSAASVDGLPFLNSDKDTCQFDDDGIGTGDDHDDGHGDDEDVYGDDDHHDEGRHGGDHNEPRHREDR